MTSNRYSAYLSSLLNFSFLVFLISIVGSFRVISSITIGAIILFLLLKTRAETGKFFHFKKVDAFITGCFLFYLLQVISLLYTDNYREGLRHLEVKSSLLAIPVIFYCFNYPTRQTSRLLLKQFIFIVFLASLFCIVIAEKKYLFDKQSSSVFFYHQLVALFNQHAVQFSLLVFIAVAWLLHNTKKGYYYVNKYIHFSLAAYFILVIVLLSSKLVISFTVLYLLYYLGRHLIKARINRRSSIAVFIICIAAIVLTMVTNNPVSKRFTEIIKGDVSLVRQETFNPAIYFNGLQFRLLQWRFVSEILNDKNAWITGVSPGDAQKAINEKYKSYNMYTGEGSSATGYLGYNSHNQFLESVLQTGIIGLASFLLICSGLIQMAWRTKNSMLPAVILLLLANAFIESVFETQYGLIIYTFFPLFLFRMLTEPGKPVNKPIS